MSCGVCLEAIERDCDDGHTTACGHRFHTQCLMLWLMEHVRCPMCRHNLGGGDDAEREEEEAIPHFTTIIAVDSPDGESDDTDAVDRAYWLGVDLAEVVAEGRVQDRRWTMRTGEWTARMRGTRKRQCLLRATVVERGTNEPKPPHLVALEIRWLRELAEVRNEMGRHVPKSSKRKWRRTTNVRRR